MKPATKARKNLEATYGAAHIEGFLNNDTTVIREKVLRAFTGSGYEIPKDVKFFKIGTGDDIGLYGMQVGSYVHSCHIDTTDFIVLLIINGCNTHVDSFSDLWLSHPFTV